MDVKSIMKLQIEKSRDSSVGGEILNGTLKELAKHRYKKEELRKDVRKFHKNFIEHLKDELEDRSSYSKNTDTMENWLIVFNNEIGENLSYYRMDSYLLADAPFIFKPVIALLKPNINDYPQYYGVDHEGVHLLIENHVLWPEVLHLSEYRKLGHIGKIVGEYVPYYIDTFEDSMAAHWIENIMEDSVHRELKDRAKMYVDCPLKHSFKWFIKNIYYDYFKIKNKEYYEKIDGITGNPVKSAPPLKYHNLKEATIERLMKVHLLSECLKDISGIEDYGDFDVTFSKIDEIINKSADKKNELAKFIYKYWHRYGTFWAYSEGNTVDFSARDLYIGKLDKQVEPERKENSFSIPTLPKFNNIVKNTDIDKRESIESNAEQRKELLKDFFERAKDAGHIYDNWTLELANEFKKMNELKSKGNETRYDKEKKELEDRLEAIFTTRRIGTKELAGDAAEMALGFLILAVPPLSPIGFGLTMYGAFRLSRKINSSRVTQMGADKNSHFYPIPMLPDKKTEYPKENAPFMWKMHLISLPYIRSESKIFSESYVNSMGSSVET